MNRDIINYLLYQLNQGKTQLYVSAIKSELEVNPIVLFNTLQKLLQSGLIYLVGQESFVFAADIGTFRNYLLALEEGEELSFGEGDGRERISYEEVIRSSWEYETEEERQPHQIAMSEAFGRNSFGDMFDDDEEIDEEMNEDDHEDCDQEDHDDDEDDDDENDDDENDDFRLKRFRLSEASKKRTEVIRQILEDLQKEILETTKQTHAEEAESSAAEEASGKAAESEGNPDKAASDRAALFTPQDSVECKTQALLRAGKAADREEALRILALKLCIEQNAATASLLQRALSIGYVHATRILEWMEMQGYVSGIMGVSRKRSILITMEQFDRVYGKF